MQNQIEILMELLQILMLNSLYFHLKLVLQHHQMYMVMLYQFLLDNVLNKHEIVFYTFQYIFHLNLDVHYSNHLYYPFHCHL